MRQVMTGLLLLAYAGLGGVRADCLNDAAAYHHVDPRLLRAIAMQESGMRDHVIATNANGSRDIGRMQINSAWLPTLARFGIHERDLLDGCVNSYVGAWILSQNIARLGLNWNAIGAYNAVSPGKRLAYEAKIYHQLLAQGAITPTTPIPPLPTRRTPRRTLRPGTATTVPAAFFFFGSRSPRSHLRHHGGRPWIS